MNSRHLWLLALGVAALVGAPRDAVAQANLAGRVQESIEVTERRIELAESLVPQADPSRATSEIALARQLQARARSAFASTQFGLAEKSTLEARNHADRAIAIVRGLPDPDRVQVQVERTAELAERARERLADCTDTRARALLRVALEMQGRAEAGVRESRHLAALQLTMSARERLFKAMRLCNVAENLGENAARALSRTDDVIARAGEVSEADETGPAREQLARAVSLQAEAKSEYRDEHFESALRLTHTARLIAKRVLQRMVSPGADSGPRERR